jgi:hypothetical protein
MLNKSHGFGTDFFVDSKANHLVINFTSIHERLCIERIKCVDVKTQRGANIDSDHMLVIIKLRYRISWASNTTSQQLRRFAVVRLNDGNVATMYRHELEVELPGTSEPEKDGGNSPESSENHHRSFVVQQCQAGFQSGKSTADRQFALRQILGKGNEDNIQTHHLFIDFKAAYDTIIHNEVYVSRARARAQLPYQTYGGLRR